MITKQAIPWKDVAVLVKEGAAGERREILAEGSLLAVVSALSKIASSEMHALSIAMPDRHVTPFRYDHQDLPSLLAAYRPAGQ